MQAMEISLSGLDVEWQRLQVIAQNLANANTARTANGSAYVPMDLVSGPKVSFDQLLRNGQSAEPTGVEIYGVEAQRTGTRRVHNPSHPQADEQGFVTMPQISHSMEMTKMIKTARVYEANLAALNASMQMYGRALELGRRI